MKLYKYSGTIEELAVERGRISYIKLFDVTDFDKAPTRLEVFGALGKYIEAIEGTDAEERYIKSDWYFDSNLYLRRIEIPGGEVGRPAKIITQSPDNIDQLEIFGPAGLYPDQQAGIHVLQGNLPLVRLGTPEHEVRRW